MIWWIMLVWAVLSGVVSLYAACWLLGFVCGLIDIVREK